MKFAGWFGLITGLSMMAMWIFFLLTGQVPELSTKPYEIAFHLAGEIFTALFLFLAAIGLLRNWKWSRSGYLIAAGMLLYTLIVSPGYYAQQAEWGFVVIFSILFILDLISIGCVLKSGQSA